MERKRNVVRFDSPKGISRTKQSFAKDADINRIVARAGKTGFLVDPSVMITRKAFFGDFAGNPGFLDMQNIVAKVDQEFMRLPVEMRDRFKNSSQLLLEFLADPANKDEAVKLGLVQAPEEVVVKDPVKDPVVVVKDPVKDPVVDPGKDPKDPKVADHVAT